MKALQFVGLLFILLSFSCSKKVEDTSSEDLQTIITEIEERESYDEEKYPLGLFSKEHFEKEANYAREQLNKLND